MTSLHLAGLILLAALWGASFLCIFIRVAAPAFGPVTFLVPVFGTLWGALFLGEAVGTATVLGMALILWSILFVTEPQRPARTQERTPSLSEGGRR